MNVAPRPLASLSLDLDNEWAYLKTRGDAAWHALPSYIPQVVPHLHAVMDTLQLRITVFVVGQDAALPAHHPWLRSLAERGHEIANHSMWHEPWMHERSAQALAEELDAAEQAIFAATGVRTVGFRGPGFSLSAPLLQELQRRGYRYDASTFPSILGPVARAYYLLTHGVSAAQRQRLARLFGRFADGLAPLRPYAWKVAPGGGDGAPQWAGPTAPLMEVPVTTMPLLRLPFHLSYVMFLAQLSTGLASAYFQLALALCRWRRVAPSVLLHPLDFLGADEVPSLRAFPGMGLSGVAKRRLLGDLLARFAQTFQVVTVAQHAAVAAADTRSTSREMPVPDLLTPQMVHTCTETH